MNVFSYLSDKCEARHGSRISHYGVFAKKNIKKNELIAAWGGSIMTAADLKKIDREISCYPLQIYDNLYLGIKNRGDFDDAEMFNHSCDPNAGVRGQNILVARRSIKKGEEICFDYETTDTRGLNFRCLCGSPSCRGRITGRAWKSPKWAKANREYLSAYILEKIKARKRRKK